MCIMANRVNTDIWYAHFNSWMFKYPLPDLGPIADHWENARMKRHGWVYWSFIVLSIPTTFTNLLMWNMFNRVFEDEVRRQNYIQKQLTFMIEYEERRKCYSAISNPVFNLLDSTTLLTWLDLRTLMKDVGIQYKLRL